MGRKMKNIVWKAAALFLCLLMPAVAVLAAADDYKIEQTYINMPEVTAYYRSPQDGDEIEAYLGGEKLNLEETARFSETGEAVEYYILLDISASISQDRFTDIKNALTQFITELRENDRLILITFGDAVNQVLNGGESREEASGIVSGLQNNNQNTMLFEAVQSAADMIWQAGNSSEARRIITVISDGKDCADDTRSAESVENVLISRGIPVYTMAVENNERDSELEKQDYRGKFAALARNTGGVPWTDSEGGAFLDGLHQMRDTVMNSYRAKFTASSNRISNQREDFVLKFDSEGNISDTCSVLVGRGQKDETPPQIVSIISGDENSISIEFSEPVANAEIVSNYSVRKDDRPVPVKQVVADDSVESGVKLLFDQELYQGEYVIEIHNVTDVSNEQNPLAEEQKTLETSWPEPEPETEEETLWELILKWWPIVLTAVFVILLIIVILVLRNLKKKKNVLIIDGKEINADQYEERKHIKMKTSELPIKNLIIWISNGRDTPRRIEYTLHGSAIIGRNEQCDIYCDDPMMSKQHFVLEYTGENIFVADLDSKNGTSVNGIAIKERYLLHSHDEILAGNLKFRIEWN